MSGKRVSSPTTQVQVVFRGPLSGPFAWVGERLIRAAAIGLRETVGTWDCLIASDAADPGSRRELDALVDDQRTIGMIGPTFSGDVESLGDSLEAAGLPFVLPLATKSGLGQHGWRGLFRMVGTDVGRAAAAAQVLGAAGANRVLVVADPAARALGDLVAGRVVAAGGAAETIAIERESPLPPAIAAALTQGAGGVFFAGEIAEAVLLKRLVDASPHPPTMVADDGILGPEYIAAAGTDLARGTLAVSPAAPPLDCDPAFLATYRAACGHDPSAFAYEAYMAGRLLGLAAASDPHRAAVTKALRHQHEITFDASGERKDARFSVHVVDGDGWLFREYATAASAESRC